MYRTKREVLEKSKEAIGHTFKDYDINHRLLRGGKGLLGQIIEEGLFGYKINSKSEADFEEAGVELKVTPYKQNKNKTFSAKERLVLNIINYHKEYKLEFENSSFWNKNKSLLLMLYLYLPEIHIGDYEITDTVLFEYPEEDLLIIKDDWEKIVAKIKDGKAHLLSESDTMYLGACTKGANRNSMRSQPFSNEMAMQRAFSLKQSYMTYILRSYILGNEKCERIITNPSELLRDSFEEVVLKRIQKYYGQTQTELKDEFGIDSEAKNINEILVSRILGVKGKVSSTEEFRKANIVPKTIRINNKGKIKEHMSFLNFKFKEIINQNWFESDLREMFETTMYLFSIFQENSQGELVFIKAFFWKVPVEILDSDIKNMWETTVEVLRNDVILTKEGNITKNNLPGPHFNGVAHIRPKAAKASYEPHNKNADELPNGEWMTKQCFWLNNSFILEQIKVEIL